jgi:hypothetical protein
MGRLPKNALAECRSPAQALADLVGKFQGISPDHPELPKLARMIWLLSDHIAGRRGADTYPRVSTQGGGFGLY